jgi:hypothetical protein
MRVQYLARVTLFDPAGHTGKAKQKQVVLVIGGKETQKQVVHAPHVTVDDPIPIPCRPLRPTALLAGLCFQKTP